MHPTILIRCMNAAVKLIKKGKAYVCDLTADQIREYRGTLTEPGKEQPVSVTAVLKRISQLFEDMKNGKYPGWRQGTACEDRYGFTEYQHA